MVCGADSLFPPALALASCTPTIRAMSPPLNRVAEAIRLLESFSQAHGAPGHEDAVRTLLLREFPRRKASFDRLGSARPATVPRSPSKGASATALSRRNMPRWKPTVSAAATARKPSPRLPAFQAASMRVPADEGELDGISPRARAARRDGGIVRASRREIARSIVT